MLTGAAFVERAVMAIARNLLKCERHMMGWVLNGSWKMIPADRIMQIV
jgi:hypothetical protein